MTHRALIVDDERLVRRLVQEVLGPRGFLVREAGDGPQGLAALRALAPLDLVVFDFRLPGFDGLSLLRQARAERLLDRTPTILISADPPPEATLVHEAVPAALEKPFDIDVLVATADRLVHQPRGADPEVAATEPLGDRRLLSRRDLRSRSWRSAP